MLSMHAFALPRFLIQVQLEGGLPERRLNTSQEMDICEVLLGFLHLSFGLFNGCEHFGLPLAVVYWKVRWNARHWSYFGASPCSATLQTPIFSWLIQVWWGSTWGQLIHPPHQVLTNPSIFPLGPFCVVRVNKLNYTIVSVEAEQLNIQTLPSLLNCSFSHHSQPQMRRNLVSVSLGRQSSRLRSRVEACGNT